MNKIIGSVLDILNNSAYLTDPYNGSRVGSFFFGPDQELNLKKYMPKGQVTDSELSTNRYSFGSASKRKSEPTINIYFYTLRGDKDPNTDNKNKSLVYDYLEKIEDALCNHMDEVGGFRNAKFGDTGEVKYDPDRKIFRGVKPVTFSKVKEN